MVRNKYISFILIVATTFLATGVGTFVTSSFKEPWYSQLILPSFNPPSWVFGPVWTTLYIMMALAVWLIWKETFNKKILQIYYIHLFFNAIWSVIFFGFHNIGLALIDLIIILIFILILMKKYFILNKTSFYFMIPYFLWSTYALILNFYIFFLN
tara:strand:+ start:34 stop:498 length:465 start_codon:yes stop_codon:yes gene_type:complete